MKRLALWVLLVVPLLSMGQSDKGNDWRFFFSSGYTQYNNAPGQKSTGGAMVAAAGGYSWENEQWTHGVFGEIRTGTTSSLGGGADVGLGYKGAIYVKNFGFGLDVGTYRRFVSMDQKQYNNWDILTGLQLRIGSWFVSGSLLTPLQHRDVAKSIFQYQIGYTQSIFNYH